MTRLTLHVAEGDEPPVDAPVDLALIDASQVALCAGALGVDQFDMSRVASAPDAGHDVRVVVALVACSMWQRDLMADLAWLSRKITVGTKVSVTVHDDGDDEADAPVGDPDPTPDEIAAAAALLARAHASNP
jgi:hypothetical protein